MNYLLIYLLITNLITSFAFLIDKLKAIKGSWRISEKSLIFLCIIGGSIGGLFSMNFFRHKTKHKKFTIGVPLILIVQILLCIFIWYIFRAKIHI